MLMTQKPLTVCDLLLRWVLVAGTLLLPQQLLAAGRSEGQPNIIFIMVDDMGYADLGCYGSQAIKTPHIDRMAAEGVRFTDAYSGSAVCAPARCALMTGKHTGHTSVRGNTGGIPLEESDLTIAEVLKEAGYRTGGFGKWGLGDIGTSGAPEKQGFDLFFGYYHQIHAHNYYPEYLVRNGKKVPISGDGEEGYSPYLIFKEMRAFIRENRDRPFFCYAPWTPPHGMYQIPVSDPALRLYGDLEGNAKIIAAMNSMIDAQVGEIMELLQELDIDDNTVIFFCSDNGAAERFDDVLDSSGPLRGEKGTMYEGGIRVPMIVRWPGRLNAGTTSHLPWYFPDLLPTLAAIGGAGEFVPTDVDGISVAPTLTGDGRQAERECLYWEWPRYDWSTKTYERDGLMQAVRCGRWKMLRHRGDEPWQLYDLSRDIGEGSDIADTHPGVVERLTSWIASNRHDPSPQNEPEMPKGKKFR